MSDPKTPNLNAYAFLDSLKDLSLKDKPPIHLWHPDVVTDIDMKITRSGDWIHEGGLIERQRLVHLFASVMRREDDGEYYLVTPVERCRIEVEDAPFIAVLLEQEGDGPDQKLIITTNMADRIELGAEHGLRFQFDEPDTPSVYARIRDQLEARINRNVYYQLMDLVESHDVDGESWLGLWSNGRFFPIMLG